MNRPILALTVLVLLAPLQGQAADDGLELTLLTGYRSGQDFDLDDETTIRIDDSEVFGANLSIPLRSHLSLEVRYNFTKTDLVEKHAPTDEPDEKISDLDISQALVGLQYSWPRRRVRPFVGFGVGGTRIEERIASEDFFTASVNGGVRVFVTDHVGFRFEGRYLWANSGDDVLNGDDITTAEAITGLIFKF